MNKKRGDVMQYKIKEVRESKRMSQEELAKKSGISRSTISGLESGKVSVTTTNTLQQIAEALNCRVSDIFLPETSSILDND